MIHLGGLTCCLGAVALYFLSRRTSRVVKSITRVYHLKDLEELLQTESKVFPLIVAVSGRVGSETPLKCEQSGILGVFVKETAQNHLLKRNWRFSWVQDTTLMQPMTKEVPWYLDDGTGRVNVVGAQGEIGFPLTLGSEVFKEAEPSSLVRGILDYLKGLKMLGVKYIERVLPIGTPLTVVGEAVMDGTGDVRIQKPEQGPFYVSPMPLAQLISKLGKWSRRFKYASMGLTVLGVILISKPVIKYILKRRRRRLSLRRVVDEAANRAEPVTRGWERQHENRSEPVTRGSSNHAAARRAEPVTRGWERQHENRSEPVTRGSSNHGAARRAEPVTRGWERQRENRSDGTSRDGDVPDLCVICLDRKCNTVFVQCGHVCCCTTCSLRLREKTCPLCRRPIEQVLKIYRH
ncbi:E3 ubiquitin-protein ligase SPL1 [Cardamine amara subsp. amara]|uniref:RING-type E3 ubiquitin transferase n=1 Tax=Cardamine amara subsp. amara TaxID=228776 RepID=A0ABD1A8F0_CARAN